MNNDAMKRQDVVLLIVDDDPTNIRVLFEFFKDSGFRTLAARNGEGAMQQARHAQPDLILLDVMMPPGINGFETCRRLKQHPQTRDIPVIFMTALSETKDKVEAFEAGGMDYITKPLQHEEVLVRVNTHVAIRRMQREVAEFHKALHAIVSERDLEAILKAGIDYAGSQQDMAFTGIWLKVEKPDKQLHLHRFTDSEDMALADLAPAEWRHARGCYSIVPLDEPLVGWAAAENEQYAAADGSEWDRPPWAEQAGFEAYIATPMMCKGVVYGVIASFYNSPINALFREKKIWHQVLAGYLGVALANARAFAEIQDLRRQIELENEYLREEVKLAGTHGSIVGASTNLKTTLEQVELVAATDAGVLILGESGTGKELIAHAVHDQSARSQGPFIKVNCAAIPRELFESEFFGHIKGAFTGAVKDRAGRFQLADGGTIFLDEVAEIPLGMQSKLLRVLQEGTFERIGDEKTRTVDVRVIAATNKDLKQEVEEGCFREDLYFRLSVFPIEIPPLRERDGDIPVLAAHLLEQVCRKMHFPQSRLSQANIARLEAYDWPGNIRELQNVIERAVILSRGGPLRFDFLPQDLGAALSNLPEGDSVEVMAEQGVIREGEWQDLQKKNILRALVQSNWRVEGEGGAAELLDLKSTTLRSRMKSMGIQKPK